MDKIKNFTDLISWQEGHKLVLEIYKLVDKFPSKEQYILTNQILRAVISITSNIAEGFSRYNKKEKVQFYFVAQSSAVEVQNQLMIARDVGYLNRKSYQEVETMVINVQKLISGLIRSIRTSY